MRHRGFTDSATADIISELVRYCDDLKGRYEAAWLSINDATMALSMCGVVPVQGRPLSNAIGELNATLTVRTRRLNELEAKIGKIAMILRDDMTSRELGIEGNGVL